MKKILDIGQITNVNIVILTSVLNTSPYACQIKMKYSNTSARNYVVVFRNSTISNISKQLIRIEQTTHNLEAFSFYFLLYMIYHHICKSV